MIDDVTFIGVGVINLGNSSRIGPVRVVSFLFVLLLFCFMNEACHL